MPYGAFPAHDVIVDHGAKGDSHYSTGGGTDDTAAFQAAYNEAISSSGCGIVAIPGNHTYRITSQLNVPRGVTTIGTGGRDGQSNDTPATIVWDGSSGTNVFSIITANASIFTTNFVNFMVTGKSAGARPTHAFYFAGSSGGAAKLDSGTYFKDMWVFLIDGDGIYLGNSGATNFWLSGGRFDSIYGGYAIKADLSGSGKSVIMQMDHVTYQGGTAGQGNGFLFMDGEAATSIGQSWININGLHSEINQTLNQTFAAGTNPFDKRGIVRLGVSSSLTQMQHWLNVNGWTNSNPGGLDSYASVQITAAAGTTADASDCVGFNIDLCSGLSNLNVSDTAATDEVRVVGGMVPATRAYPWAGNYRTGRISWGQGKDATGEGFRSYSHTRHGADVHRGLTLQTETVGALDAFPPNGGAFAYVTDAASTTVVGSIISSGGSVKAVAFYNGSNWLAIAIA